MMWGYMKAVVFHPVKAYRISLAVMEEDEWKDFMITSAGIVK
jgi:hypothetical protein